MIFLIVLNFDLAIRVKGVESRWCPSARRVRAGKLFDLHDGESHRERAPRKLSGKAEH